MRERWAAFAFLALVAQIPFELKYTFLGLSNLQWTFAALAVLTLPDLLGNWRKLSGDRLVQAAALFVVIQWLAAAYAPEYHANAFKAAVRFTAGFVLLAVVRTRTSCPAWGKRWSYTALVAASCAIAGYAGFGLSWLFRDQEHYIGQVQRLSGTFEYPNTAAAYFAMSLPIVWWSFRQRILRWPAGFLLWSALLLTYSRSAITALAILLAGVTLAGARLDGIRSAKAASLLAAGVAACAVLIPISPNFLDVFMRTSPAEPLKAEYRAPWNTLQHQPNVNDQIRLNVANTGTFRWMSKGRARVAVSYRWLRQDSRLFLRTPGEITELPHDVAPGDTVEVVSTFRTPILPGKYILAIELFSRDFDWFSRTGVVPFLIEADIRQGSSRLTGSADLSHWYETGQDSGVNVTAAVSRRSLWRAGFQMFLDHPFGVGPDNYRLHYGRYLGASHWDTNIYSNSLYLELLTGSGFMAIASFGLLIFRIRWAPQAACLALAVFLLHGFADVFIMATPIYLTFWMLLGKTPANGVEVV